MFWLHLKWLFWSINSIRPLFEALRRGQIFGQNYAWNHNLSADLFFFDIYMSLRAISLLKMPKHVTSSLQMTMSKNLSMDPQIFFLMVPKTDDGRKGARKCIFQKCRICAHVYSNGVACQSNKRDYPFSFPGFGSNWLFGFSDDSIIISKRTHKSPSDDRRKEEKGIENAFFKVTEKVDKSTYSNFFTIPNV